MSNPEAPDRIPIEEVLDLVRRVYAKQAPKRTISLTFVTWCGTELTIKGVRPDPDHDNVILYKSVYGTEEALPLGEDTRVIKVQYTL